MVPHCTVEQRLASAFGWDQNDSLSAVIIGVPDTSKGEALVLLTTHEVTLAEVRAKLLESGLPNLWLPKLVCRVDHIPVLATGKTDLKGCRAIALETIGAAATA
jgi:acyl-[acyl-carrier-protein]-phospholipid O-acyltransferase/long-chain-fatty-acid--[acyl-carrier-protein] ligase